MKYSKDTYRLYDNENRYSYSIRLKVTMKDYVDGGILTKAVNTAIQRYPYFAVKVALGPDGGYTLEPNSAPVAVLPLIKRIRALGSKEVNEHLVFVEYNSKDIYFNISHSITGGTGAQQWAMTSVYQYVKDRYHFEPKAPSIRKPGEALFEDETAEITREMLEEKPPIAVPENRHPTVMMSDYLNGIFNPFLRNQNYFLFQFHQKDVVDFIKAHDASVVSFFLVVMAKAMDIVLPEKEAVIGGETAHNPVKDFGIPNSHTDMLSFVYIDYDRNQVKWNMEKLGTMTRGQILWQTDPTVSSAQLRKLFDVYEKTDKIKGLAEKRKFIKENNPRHSADARHGTYTVNYTGQMDWGEVADYVDSYCIIVEGHLLCEVTSMADQIFFSVMQLVNTEKYIDAIREILDELRVPYKVDGPYPKHLSRHSIPVR